MSRTMFKTFSFALIIFCFASCEEEYEAPKIKWSKKQSTDINKAIAAEEEIDIQLFTFIGRQPFKYNSTGTGLRYAMMTDGSGMEVQTRDNLRP